MSPTLLAAGYINVDITALVDRLPGFGGRVTAHSISRSPGGMTANMACAAAQLGLTTHFFGSVGRDAEGDHAVSELQRFSVQTDGIIRTDSTTVALVLLGPDKERAIISEPLHFDYEALDTALHALTDEKFACLHVDGYRLPEAVGVLRKARRIGLATSADLDGLEHADFERSVVEIAASLDVAFLNRRLAKAIAPNPEAAAAKLTGLGIETVALTLGGEGALVAEPGQTNLFCPPSTEVDDTTGAGDVFAGAFLAEFLRSKDAREAGRFAVAASAISVSGSGARGHLPDRKEVECLLNLVKRKELSERSYSE